ncbi:hypothetical protein HU200_054217 [Digitaria exilis]|uniref:Uncharacterized protein n=1 Tax=Digitaria exilis TaxID=1010633 RepID=A0A835ALH0_9POAL|nr:hypothetical protein HU200_054217 [Digitaria exilis]
MSPCFDGAKRPLQMVLYNPSAAAANKRARQEEATTSSSSSAAGAASSSEPALVVLDVKPINAMPPPRLPRRALLPPSLAAAEREAPPCLRSHFLQWLGLRDDVPVHFIDDKVLTDTDLNPHQNRFRIRRDGVMRRLLPLLTPTEVHQANLLDDNPPRPRPPRNKDGAQGNGNKLKKPKAKGKVHGGLRVKLVDLMAGAKELLMSRWHSSRGTVLKGEGYLDFVRRCSFREKDAVEIWAFVQRRVRLFGSDLCHDSLLHVLVVKKDHLPQHCRCCTAVNPSTNLVMA